MSDSEPRSIFCASCGKPTTPDAKFCKNCGAPANGGQQTAPSGDDAASITEKLNGFRFRLTAKCPHCGYLGLMGWNDFYFSVRKAVWMPIALLLCLLGIIPGLIVFLVVQRTKRYQAQCPNCGKQVLLKTKEAQPVKSAWGGAQFFDANGQTVAGGTILARAGKWALIGVAGLVGLLVLLAAAGMLIDKAGWRVPNAQTASTENAAPPPPAYIAPSTSPTPSVPQDDKHVATVRSGILAAPYNTTTIGKAFEATFADPKWRSFETAKGQRIVEFTGRLKPEMYKKDYLDHLDFCASQPPSLASCGPEYKDEMAISTVKLQFDLTADGSSFSVGYIDEKPWFFTSLFNHGSGQINPEEILAYIYK